MPELTLIGVGLSFLILAIGLVAGWLVRANRCAREKQAINAGWQDQIAAQKSEHNRLADQNKSLMEQISQFQASRKDSENRARELSASLREAFERRDELQRQMKDLRDSLEATTADRDRLRSAMDEYTRRNQSADGDLQERDDKIARLNRELQNWQDRLPPLMERFRTRDLEARQLEEELAQAKQRIAELESPTAADETHIEQVESNPLTDGLDASNDQYDETAENEVAVLGDERADDSDVERRGDGAADGSKSDSAGDDDGTDAGEARADGSHAPADVDIDLTGAAERVDGDDDTEADNEGPSPDGSDSTGRFDTGGDATAAGAPAVRANGALPEDARDDFPAPAAGGTSSSRQGNGDGEPARDDLQQIKGVGPAIEKTLNDLGIYRFEQIATMSEYEIDRVAREFKGFRSRIYREDWIGQARMLQVQKDGEQG